MKSFFCALLVGFVAVSQSNASAISLELQATPLRSPQHHKCAKSEICTTQHDPVCGRLERSGQVIYRTFGNECELRNQKCQHPETAFVKHGKVGKTCAEQKFQSECSQVCYGLHHPVCGALKKSGQTFYRTFSNDCLFWQENCLDEKHQYEQQGTDGQSCKDLDLSNVCSDVCYTLELPVCGLQKIDGMKIYKTFSNECLLEQTNCRNPDTPFVQQGPAGQSCAAQRLTNECSDTCATISEPRCAKITFWFDIVWYRTFANNCLLVQHNCRWPHFAYQPVGDIGKTCREQR